MAKVKKRTAVTGVRNTGARKRAGTKAGPQSNKKPSSKRGKQAKQGMKPTPVVRVAVKALDPIAKCGPGTSVESLYRVDESIDGRVTTHLVFFDRHGWYCEHGRNCPAVAHAKKQDGQLARAS